MWIFTTLGFFSCTRSVQRPDLMQIRARCEGDLKNLKRRCPYLKGKIFETRHADYRWRLLCQPATWVRVAADLAAAVDYSNFKASIDSDQRDKPLIKVWQAMADFQDERHRARDMHADHPVFDGFEDFEDQEPPEAPKNDWLPNLGLRYGRL